MHFERIHFYIFLSFLSLYLLTLGRTQEYGYADGSVMFHVTQSMVEEGSLKSRVPAIYRGHEFIGHSKYGIGYSLVSIPFYLVAKGISSFYPEIPEETFTRRSLMVTNAWISAFLNVALFMLYTLIFQRKDIALLLTCLSGMATLIWAYARSDFSEPLTTLWMVLSFCVLWEYIQNNTNKYAFLSGLFLGLAILTRFVCIILLPLWFLFLIINNRQLFYKFLEYFIVPFFVCTGCYLWYDFYRYGSIWKTGYETDVHNPLFGNIFFTGLYGLFLSPGKGLFWYNPILLLAFLGIPYFWEKNRKLFIISFLLVFIHFLLYSAWPAWEGGWCWGPRVLIPTIPFLMISVGYWVTHTPLSKIIRNIIILFLGLLGFSIQWVGITYNYNFYIQQMLARNIPFNDIWMVPSFSPIIGHFWGTMNLSFPLWDFLFFWLLQTPLWVPILGIVLLLIILLFLAGMRVWRELYNNPGTP